MIVALHSLMLAADCFFGASLILAIAWLITRRGTAAQRHLVWLGAFIAMLVLPLAAEIVPPGFTLHMPAPAPMPVATDVAVAAVPAASTPSIPSITVADVVTALLIVWLLGVLAIAVRMLIGMAGLMLLMRRSVPHIPDGIDGEKFRGARWQLRLRTSPGGEGPVTWGIFKSVVLLPKTSVRWSRDRLDAVLLHEFAHVRRRDSLARLIALVACALYWPNPFVWSAAARMRRDAEIAADDAVLSAGVRASAYAEALVGLAREFGEHASFAGVTLSMAEPSGLKARVQSVLSSQQLRSGASMMDVLKVAALGVAVTAGLAMARPCLAEARASSADGVTTTRVVQNDQDVRDSDSEPADQQVGNQQDSDIPPAPPVPPAPHASAVLPAPPAPAAMPELPAPPAPPADIAPPAPPSPPMTAEQRKEFHRAMAAQRAELHRAQAEMHRAAAEVRKALASAHIDQTVAQALKDAEPAMHQARQISRAEIRHAIEQAHISERVAEAMEKARPDIEKAIAEAHKAAADARRHATEADGDQDAGH